MSDAWTEQRLQQYINDEVPESLSLEYKRGIVLSKNAKKNPKWLEALTKDISALANSAGGILVYGIAENNDKPTGFSPVDKSEFSRETLDQIISSNIKPRIDGLVIHPVSLSSGENDTAYVIEIPQSNTAHQAYDKRYHKRLNTTTTSMEDYEIRDVMRRGNYPKFEFKFSLVKHYFPYDLTSDKEQKKYFNLNIHATNVGNVITLYYTSFFDVPRRIVETRNSLNHSGVEINDEWHERFVLTNFSEKSNLYIPIQPGLTINREIPISKIDTDIIIRWQIFADDAPVNTGNVNLKDIELRM